MRARAQSLTDNLNKGAKIMDWSPVHGSKKCMGVPGLESSDPLSGEVMKRCIFGPLDLCVHPAHRILTEEKGETRGEHASLKNSSKTPLLNSYGDDEGKGKPVHST